MCNCTTMLNVHDKNLHLRFPSKDSDNTMYTKRRQKIYFSVTYCYWCYTYNLGLSIVLTLTKQPQVLSLKIFHYIFFCATGVTELIVLYSEYFITKMIFLLFSWYSFITDEYTGKTEALLHICILCKHYFR